MFIVVLIPNIYALLTSHISRNKMNFKEKVVLITGGTHGIGLAIAKELSSQGAKVIITGRSLTKADHAITELGAKATFIQCDISIQESVSSLFKEIVSKFGGLDFSINNAGITSKRNKVAEMDVEDWKNTFDINVTGTMLCMKYGLPLIAKNPQGAIVNISSCAGVTPIPNQSAYSASKSAVNCLTQAAAIEYAQDSKHGYAVRINAIAPGPTLGGMNTPERLAANPESTKQKLAVTAMKRMAEPKEVVSAVLFLLGEQSSYVTGTVLNVDGGYSSGKFS